MKVISLDSQYGVALPSPALCVVPAVSVAISIQRGVGTNKKLCASEEVVPTWAS